MKGLWYCVCVVLIMIPPEFSNMLILNSWLSYVFVGHPDGLKKAWNAQRKQLHLNSCKVDIMASNYDLLVKKLVFV